MMPSAAPSPLEMSAREDALRLPLQELLWRADGWRLRQALRHVESTFAAAGTPVICAAQEDAAALILLQVERLRRLQRGVG